MNVLWLTPEPPLPPYSGGRERSRRMLAYVAARQAVHLVTYASQAEVEPLEELRPRLAGLTALPYPGRGMPYGGPMRAAVRELRPAGGGWQAVHAQGLALWGAARSVPGARRVLDLFDLPAVVQARLIEARGGTRPGERLALFRTRRAEAQAVRQADRVIVASAHDAATLRAAHGDAIRVVVVPNGVDLDYWQATRTLGAPEPQTLLFAAALNYPPNVDAAAVLVDEVLPRVRAVVPEARVVLAGRLPGPAVRALRARPGVMLCADPDDMRPLLARAALVVVPLRAGSGTRLKILQALAAGRPVVSTPLGAEGLDLTAGRGLVLASLIEPFAAEVVRLLRDPAGREALAAAGKEVAKSHAWADQLRPLEKVMGNW